MFHCIPFKKLGTEIVNTRIPSIGMPRQRHRQSHSLRPDFFTFLRYIRRLLVRHALFYFLSKNDNLCPIKAVISIH